MLPNPKIDGGRFMASLAELQSAFAESLVDPSRPAPPGISKPAACDISPARHKRFDVYRNNLVMAAITALQDSFPACHRLVGDAFFKATARAYFYESPPTSPLLFQYGASFGEFLDRFPPASKVPYLGDVARLEFARLSAYHAADLPTLHISKLGAVPAHQLSATRLRAHPSLTLVRSSFPVLSLWAASTGQMDSDQVEMGQAEDVLVVRPALEVVTRLLPPGGGIFLNALLAGLSLGEAASVAAESVENFDLSMHLSGLFQAGAFQNLCSLP